MSLLRNLALTIEYDGTAFRGWQIQPGQRTIEAELQKALEVITHQPVRLFSASRTDAGVHARGQVASFHCASAISPERLQAGLNQILPEDIAILKIQEKPAAFHARHDAKGKWYRYTVFQREAPPAIERFYALAVRQTLRLKPMEEAAKLLIGTHDFRCFGVKSTNESEDPVKTIYELNITKEDSKIYFDIVGNSFLYRMVRSLVGTLLDVGKGKRKAQNILEILQSKDRGTAGVTVAPLGLCLMQVFYEVPPPLTNQLI